jgi:hypothetical protein
MDEGFIADRIEGGHQVPQWVEGAPEKSFWTGLKIKGRSTFPVRTFRCRHCGFLESYARGGL